jgi:transcriptional regulator with XRE-family HTH domain
MQSTVNERLKILVDALGTNPGALSKILGISPSTLRNYLDRDSKPGYEVIEKLYNSFKHINLLWLFGEPGEPLLPGVNSALTTISAKKNKGSVIGTNHSPLTQTFGQNSVTDCERERDALRIENEWLRLQLKTQEELIAAKNETISILRVPHHGTPKP